MNSSPPTPVVFQSLSLSVFMPRQSGRHIALLLSVRTYVRPYVRTYVRTSVRTSRNVVSRVDPKVFQLESWNFTGMLASTCSCAPGVSLLDSFGTYRIIAPDLVKIARFQLVSRVHPKVFRLESWNFTGMLASICSCAPGVSLLDSFGTCRIIAPD